MGGRPFTMAGPGGQNSVGSLLFDPETPKPLLDYLLDCIDF
jgi:hypothetical protein